MMLQLHNSATGKIEPFKNSSSGVPVLIYTCGPTVYDYQHIGNYMGYLYWDILIRYFRSSNIPVKRVMNITDVGHLTSDADEGEDKLEKGARREGKNAWEIAQFYTDDFIQSFDELGMIRPHTFAKATDYISQQIELIRTLRQKGHTYQIEDGIYFDVSTFPNYTKFANLHLNDQQGSGRVVKNEQKKHPYDFALWKFSPTSSTRDMEWDTPNDILDNATTPSKKGFPGWHIECSGIALSLLGESIDIHTGGIDHIPIHHTNEIAQSESATGKQFVQCWLHNNHLMIDGSKIAKSTGNGITLHNIKSQGFQLDDFRMFVVEGHYRSERNFSWISLASAQQRLKRWRSVAALRHQVVPSGESNALSWIAKWNTSLESDLSTPEMLVSIEKVLSDVENGIATEHISANFIEDIFGYIDDSLGFNILTQTQDISDDVKSLIHKRALLRKEEKWDQADLVRDDLRTHGIGIKDVSGSQIWFYL